MAHRLMDVSEPSEATILEKATILQEGLVAFATGKDFEGGDERYKRLRQDLLARSETKSRVPNFVRRYRSLDQFWQFIKNKSATYAGRRQYLWDQFHEL